MRSPQQSNPLYGRDLLALAFAALLCSCAGGARISWDAQKDQGAELPDTGRVLPGNDANPPADPVDGPTDEADVPAEPGSLEDEVSECRAGEASCDEDWSTGCETDITSSTEHCGACAKPCSIEHGDAASPHEMTSFHGAVFFGADNGQHGRELWSSDGTEAGTVMVKDIHPGGSSSPSDLSAAAGTLFFEARDGTHGQELWALVDHDRHGSCANVCVDGRCAAGE